MNLIGIYSRKEAHHPRSRTVRHRETAIEWRMNDIHLLAITFVILHKGIPFVVFTQYHNLGKFPPSDIVRVAYVVRYSRYFSIPLYRSV